MKRHALIFAVMMFLAAAAVAQTAAAPKLKLPEYTKSKLTNGMTVYLMERHEVPLISLAFLVRTGTTADPAGKEGVGSLTANLLRKGTATRTADQISEQLDFLGGQFSADANVDYTRGRAEFMKKDIAEGLDLVSDLLLRPNFPQAELTKLVQQRVDGIKAAKDRAQAVLETYFLGYLYGRHPYGRPANGDENSLKAITREDVVAFHRAHYTPDNVIIAVAGDFSTPDMQKLIDSKFGGWTGKAVAISAVPAPAPVAGKRLLLVDKPDSTQTYYMVGNIGIARTNPDRVYIDVVNTLFGGRFTSMINSELRIKSGLTYGAASRFERDKVPGPFYISTYTRNASTEKAMDMTLDVMKRLHEKGITQEELDSARAYIKGQFPPEIETADQLASLLTTLDFYGLDDREVNELYDRLDRMDLPTARRVIQQYFPQDNLVFVLIGKASEIEPVVKKYAAQMDKKSITQPGF